MHESIMEQLWQTSHLQGGNLAYVEQLFETYLTDPNAIPEEWRSYFDKLPGVDGQTRDIAHSTIRRFTNSARLIGIWSFRPVL